MSVSADHLSLFHPFRAIGRKVLVRFDALPGHALGARTPPVRFSATLKVIVAGLPAVALAGFVGWIGPNSLAALFSQVTASETSLPIIAFFAPLCALVLAMVGMVTSMLMHGVAPAPDRTVAIPAMVPGEN